MSKVICAFAGLSKTYLSKKYSNIIDFDLQELKYIYKQGDLFNIEKLKGWENKLKNIYFEAELLELNTMRKFGNSEFSTKPTNYYNLDMIIAVSKNIAAEIVYNRIDSKKENIRKIIK